MEKMMRKIRHNLWWISTLCIFSGAVIGLPAKNSTQFIIGFCLIFAAGVCALFVSKEN